VPQWAFGHSAFFMISSSPIVVLDSGLGGLTVVRALREAMPAESVLYFGDTARLPYGSKTASTVTGFVRQIVDYLRAYDPKHVVIACNTATALALSAVRPMFPTLPISGVIEPGAKAAVIAAGAKAVPVIGVIATEATVRSKAYERAIAHRRHHARLLLRPTPLLVPIIEEGRRENDPLVRLALRQYLTPMLKSGLDVLVLGCTHYPILRKAICEVVGDEVKVIDSAEQCAQDVARRLRARGLARQADEPGPPVSGALRTFVTDDPLRFRKLASRFLGVEIDPPTWVSPDELYPTRPAEPARISVPA
jgi:glutamate racemase